MNRSTLRAHRVRAWERALVATSWLLSCSCGRAASADPVAAHDTRAALPPAAPAAPSAPSVAPSLARSVLGSSIRVDTAPLAPLGSEVPLVEIARPASGELLERLAIRSQEVRVRVELPAALPAGLSVWVALDGQRPRVLPPAGTLRLGDLIPEDQDLRDGQHVLFAVAVDPQGRVLRVPEGPPRRGFSLVEFFIGERTGELAAPSPARLFCLSPSGTLYGLPSEPLQLELYAIGAASQAGSVPLLIEAAGESFATRVDASRSHTISGLPRGDVRFVAGAAPGPRAECIVTLNPAASPSKAP